MKWLTLNVHSWIEEDTERKMDILARYILSNDLDGISLQEVNQRRDALVEEQPHYFIPSKQDNTPIKQDNYALYLVKRLAALGVNYYWSWTYSHVGYGIYEEGVAILSKTPLQPEAVLVSSVNEKEDVKRRMMLCAKVTVDNKDILVTSNHYSWWHQDAKQGFQVEWALTTKFLNQFSCPKLLCGDFNGPDTIKSETYDLVTETFIDTYQIAKNVSGRFTIPKEIDGWKNVKEQLRIDYIFVSKECSVKSSEVVFDGKLYPCVSDHYGVVVSMDMK